MEQLNRSLIPESDRMDHLPERVVQIGEGNFLRAFVDWMIHRMNKQGLFNGKVVAIQPTPRGKVVPKLNAQDGLYTVVLRGIRNQKTVDEAEVVTSVSRGINPYEDWDEVLKTAENPDIRFMFSNTTEAGLTYAKESYDPKKSPLSFPGKVVAFLHHRYRTLGDAGLTIIPCELVENNGDVLKEIVLKIAKDWDLDADFIDWVQTKNRFLNTLVDRIVTGYPKDDREEFRQRLGYDDVLLTVGEPYHLFAIDGDPQLEQELPLQKAGLNVHWSPVEPFRNLKVRILNGAHTMMFAAAYLCGKETVLDVMEDERFGNWVRRAVDEEILPVVDEKESVKKEFADSVIERFQNPYNRHYLKDLGLNAVYKWRTRLLPTLLDWVEQKQALPPSVVFSLAALFVYYRPERMSGDRAVISDSKETTEYFRQVWNLYDGSDATLKKIVGALLGHEAFWGTDLNRIQGLSDRVEKDLSRILKDGMERAFPDRVR